MERNSLDAIYQQYMKDVYRYLLSLSRDHHIAEELVQETFYRAYLFLEQCREEKIKPWLFKVAYNAFIDFKRREKRSDAKETDFFEQLADGNTPETELMRQEYWDGMERTIAGLPDNQKQALLLYDFHQLSYKEAADVMEISLSHFKILLFRARQKLRQNRERNDVD
ncbi:sigma-70 family RNA polymerase sigma factor [Paenibacillus sp. MSJ-34]|uniref:sigma-70 family RNA polymerase sigma factor n=1 Tax=Paenibacillus sp. MSJ-34 TaxID=2841529 RepID=UPI001C1247DF|nr:sigma-70 family RNA polymerase sigma factor [Paenibacillus sp. MSJ-34]MBU5441284.1 sigma-70 family RNA polymerase sigma factor [Paenibacillus sp. MSJ-34]